MAATRDTTVTAGRSRGTGSGIVLAGDRTVSRLVARRHSTIVKALKIGLPVSALAIVGTFATSILQTAGWGTNLPELAMPQILPESLKMENPHYEGFSGDGGRYWVKAASARQDLKALTVIRLEGITGEMIDGNKQTTKLTAKRGTFDSKASVLELFDAIDVNGDGGVKAVLTRATVRTKEGLITSDQPVSVAMQAGAITARQMKIRQKTKEYTFVDEVKARVNAPDKPTAAAGSDAASSSQTFGEPGQPIDITANRLDVDDAKKNALFSGQVVAVQGGSTLTSPDLVVTYVGEALTSGGGAKATQTSNQAGDQSGKVKSITASDPVVMRQADGNTVTSRSATFDALARTAVLEGDIVMTQAPETRATGDRADFDESNGTVTLSGAVVVTQGGNELRGRKLVFNRATGRMQLAGTGAAARIAARFVQSGRKAAAPSAPEATRSGGGIPFGASFKTDPDAPVQVEADRLDVDDGSKKATFSGDVRAKQGDFNIRAAELVASYVGSASLGGDSKDAGKKAAAQLTRIVAKKKVQIASKDGQNATGDWAEFDTKANIATLGGDVVLTQGKNVVRGTKLIIDMNTGESTIRNDSGDSSGGGAMISSSEGDGDGVPQKSSRPSAVFYPSDMKEPASKAADKAGGGWQARTKN